MWEREQWHPAADFAFFANDVAFREDVLHPNLVCLCEDGEPSALLLGRVVSGPLGLHLGYRLLGWPRARLLEIVQGGTLGECGWQNCELLLSEIERSLRMKEADLAVFRNLPVDSIMYQLIARTFGFPSRGVQPAVTWSVSLPDSYKDFMLMLGKRTRATVVRYSNLTSKKYGDRIHLRSYREREDIDLILKDTEAVASRTWQRGVRKGFLDDHLTRTRYSLALHRGQLRAYVLYVDKGPIAFWHGLCYGDTFYAEYTGFDPAYRDDRPGAYMLARIIEELCEDPSVHRIDFGEGDHEYKQHYCRQGRAVADVYVYSPTLYGFALKAVKSSFDRTKITAKVFLRNAQLLNRTRKTWKRQLARG